MATDLLEKAIWDAVEVHIDATPADGINAEGEYSPAVMMYQKKYVDGLRAARLAAINAAKPALLSALKAKETDNAQTS